MFNPAASGRYRTPAGLNDARATPFRSVDSLVVGPCGEGGFVVVSGSALAPASANRLPAKLVRGCWLEVIPAGNILFASEMVGAVRGIDPETGHYFDDTKRYIDASALDDTDRAKIFEGNARKVFSRLGV